MTSRVQSVCNERIDRFDWMPPRNLLISKNRQSSKCRFTRNPWAHVSQYQPLFHCGLHFEIPRPCQIAGCSRMHAAGRCGDAARHVGPPARPASVSAFIKRCLAPQRRRISLGIHLYRQVSVRPGPLSRELSGVFIGSISMTIELYCKRRRLSCNTCMVTHHQIGRNRHDQVEFPSLDSQYDI